MKLMLIAYMNSFSFVEALVYLRLNICENTLFRSLTVINAFSISGMLYKALFSFLIPLTTVLIIFYV